MINVLLIFTATKNKQTIKATTTTILNLHLRRKDKTSYNNMIKGVRKQQQQQHSFQETTLSHTESFHFHMFLQEQT